MSDLSLNKLQNIFYKKKLKLCRIFCIENMCTYIEVKTSTDDRFLIYVQSKFSVPVENLGGVEIYEIDYIDVSEEGIVREEGGELMSEQTANSYQDISPDIGINENSDNLETVLEESYSTDINLSEKKSYEIKSELNSIFKQLNRLKLCLKSVKYKIAVITRTFICSVRRDSGLECFYTKGMRKQPKKMYITIDLESFIIKLESVETDIYTIRNSIYNVLNVNLIKQTRLLEEMFNKKRNVQGLKEKVIKITTEYRNYENALVDLIEKSTEKENKINLEIQNIREKYNVNKNPKFIHLDIERCHQIGKREEILGSIKRIRNEIYENLKQVRKNHENVSLTIDNIYFELSLQTDSINKNISSLKNI